MSIASTISDFVKNWASKEELYLKVGVATDIDESDFTFKFTPIDEKSVVEDVRMKAIVDGNLESFVIVPKEGTKVVVGFHSNTVGQCVMVQEADKVLINSNIIQEIANSKILSIQNDYNIFCDDVNVTTESWVFNSGVLGGLINISQLTTKLNGLVTEVNAIKTKFNTHKHVGVSTGAGISGITNTLASDATAFDKADYEDEKIKH